MALLTRQNSINYLLRVTASRWGHGKVYTGNTCGKVEIHILDGTTSPLPSTACTHVFMN